MKVENIKINYMRNINTIFCFKKITIIFFLLYGITTNAQKTNLKDIQNHKFIVNQLNDFNGLLNNLSRNDNKSKDVTQFSKDLKAYFENGEFQMYNNFENQNTSISKYLDFIKSSKSEFNFDFKQYNFGKIRGRKRKKADVYLKRVIKNEDENLINEELIYFRVEYVGLKNNSFKIVSMEKVTTKNLPSRIITYQSGGEIKKVINKKFEEKITKKYKGKFDTKELKNKTIDMITEVYYENYKELIKSKIEEDKKNYEGEILQIFTPKIAKIENDIDEKKPGEYLTPKKYFKKVRSHEEQLEIDDKGIPSCDYVDFNGKKDGNVKLLCKQKKIINNKEVIRDFHVVYENINPKKKKNKNRIFISKIESGKTIISIPLPSQKQINKEVKKFIKAYLKNLKPETSTRVLKKYFDQDLKTVFSDVDKEKVEISPVEYLETVSNLTSLNSEYQILEVTKFNQAKSKIAVLISKVKVSKKNEVKNDSLSFTKEGELLLEVKTYLDKNNKIKSMKISKIEGDDFNLFEDQDNDGIADNIDKCKWFFGYPCTDGCPDGDNDCIPDAEDVCPDLEGTVAYRGCPNKEEKRFVNYVISSTIPMLFDSLRKAMIIDGKPNSLGKLSSLKSIFSQEGKDTIMVQSCITKKEKAFNLDNYFHHLNQLPYKSMKLDLDIVPSFSSLGYDFNQKHWKDKIRYKQYFHGYNKNHDLVYADITFKEIEVIAQNNPDSIKISFGNILIDSLICTLEENNTVPLLASKGFEVEEQEDTYKIQITTYSNERKSDYDFTIFKYLGFVSEEYDEEKKIVRVVIEDYKTYNDAIYDIRKVRIKGFKEAEIVEYKNGIRQSKR